MKDAEALARYAPVSQRSFRSSLSTQTMAQTPSETPAEKIELYERLIATHPEIKRKGARFGYTSLNGNMFTILAPPGTLAIRLPPADRDLFIERYRTSLHESHGVVMKEYVRVPDDLLARTDELKTYLELSYEYAKTLKPKPTKRRKPGSTT